MDELEKLLNIVEGRDHRQLIINHSTKEIKASVLLCSQNYLDAEYVKTIFTDGSFLLIMLAGYEIYYANKIIGHIQEIPDKAIGRQKLIHYQNKDYELGNADDYQFVKQLFIGSPLDIEGECRFSDYFPISGPKEFLSLGWLSRTGERADINPRITTQNQISFVGV